MYRYMDNYFCGAKIWLLVMCRKMTVKIIVSVLLTALILATWLASELQEVSIT